MYSIGILLLGYYYKNLVNTLSFTYNNRTLVVEKQKTLLNTTFDTSIFLG